MTKVPMNNEVEEKEAREAVEHWSERSRGENEGRRTTQKRR